MAPVYLSFPINVEYAELRVYSRKRNPSPCSNWLMSTDTGQILLFAAAYPDSLLPTSIRGILTNGATLLLSPTIGSWVDRNASRFHTMKMTIVVQRACIVAGCLLWMLLFLSAGQTMAEGPQGQPMLSLGRYLPKDLIIAILVVFGVVERVCAVGNNLVMERDWVPTTLACPTPCPSSAYRA